MFNIHKFFPALQFANPEALWLILVLPAVAVIYFWIHGSTKVSIPTLNTFKGFINSIKAYFIHLPILLRLIGLFFLIIVIARPQQNRDFNTNYNEGIDIILCMDISTSMLANDFNPNRLEAAKDVAYNFVGERKQDRIGFVAFNGQALTICPLTTNYQILQNLIKEINTESLGGEGGTAIGSGIATSVNRLKNSKSSSKIVILLTDGSNNAGIEPLDAAEVAKTLGVRVYTIGMGASLKADVPTGQTNGGIFTFGFADTDIDEPTMTEIASITNAKYFRASDSKSLENVYKEIDKLEKTRTSENKFKPNPKELYLPYLLIAFFIFVFEFIFKRTYLKGLV
jgi:Ca-activated chloride channel family protein